MLHSLIAQITEHALTSVSVSLKNWIRKNFSLVYISYCTECFHIYIITQKRHLLTTHLRGVKYCTSFATTRSFCCISVFRRSIRLLAFSMCVCFSLIFVSSDCNNDRHATAASCTTTTAHSTQLESYHLRSHQVQPRQWNLCSCGNELRHMTK